LSEPALCCRVSGGYCDRCDLLVGLDGLHVTAVERDDGGGLTVTVESAAAPMGCRSCGVVAHAHGRVEVRLVDAPAMGRPVRVRWRKRRWLCPDPACRVRSFVEQDEQIAAPRATLTTRACWWAIEQDWMARVAAQVLPARDLAAYRRRDQIQRRRQRLCHPVPLPRLPDSDPLNTDSHHRLNSKPHVESPVR